MFDLNGKNALITGASGGIGSEIARAIYARGARVILSARRVRALESLATELGERAFIIACDLSNKEELAKLPKQAADIMGGIDILVNNAGIVCDNLIMRMSDQEWQQVIDVNLTSTMRLIKAFTRPMMKKRWGRIVNITSVIGTIGNAGQANYAATKAAITALTKSYAQEVASRGITANCIAPGFIETAMTANLPQKKRQNILMRIPQASIGVPKDVAAAVIYLISQEARYVTGQTLHVNGGMLMV